MTFISIQKLINNHAAQKINKGDNTKGLICLGHPHLRDGCNLSVNSDGRGEESVHCCYFLWIQDGRGQKAQVFPMFTFYQKFERADKTQHYKDTPFCVPFWKRFATEGPS